MRLDEVLQRIQGEFVEMPGLRLTAAQAGALAPVAAGSRPGAGARVALAAVVLAGAALLAAGALALRGVHRPQASRS